MPTIKLNNNFVMLGLGKTNISTLVSPHSKSRTGAICFAPLEKTYEVGEYHNEEIDFTDPRIRLIIFNNKKSIDVLIGQLEELKARWKTIDQEDEQCLLPTMENLQSRENDVSIASN